MEQNRTSLLEQNRTLRRGLRCAPERSGGAQRSPRRRRVSHGRRTSRAAADEKQLCHRLPPAFAAAVLADCNAGHCAARSACARRELRRSQRHTLRHRWLSVPAAFAPRPSGGDHAAPWSSEAAAFAAAFLPHCSPLNFALLADELARRFDFHRSRAALAAGCRQHLPALAAKAPKPGPKPRRRWQTGSIGALWPHDSSPHPWWLAPSKPLPILTSDDHSRKIAAGRLVPQETTRAHFTCARSAITAHGAPQACCTGGRSLFGAAPHTGPDGVRSQFQRALLGRGAAHRAAPDPRAKGKIQRRCGIFQNRPVSLLRAENLTDFPPASALRAEPVAWDNARHVCRTTGLTADHAWQLGPRPAPLQAQARAARAALRPPLRHPFPPPLLERPLHRTLRAPLARRAHPPPIPHHPPPPGCPVLGHPSFSRSSGLRPAFRPRPLFPRNRSQSTGPVLLQHPFRFCSAPDTDKLFCVWAGTKPEWRRNKSGRGESGRSEAWVGRLGGGRSAAEAGAEATDPRFAFLLQPGRGAVRLSR